MFSSISTASASLTMFGFHHEPWRPDIEVHGFASDDLRAQIVTLLYLSIVAREGRTRHGQRIEISRLALELYCALFALLHEMQFQCEALRYADYVTVEGIVKERPQWPLIPHMALGGQTPLQVSLKRGDAYMILLIKDALKNSSSLLALFYAQAKAHRDIFLTTIEQTRAKIAESFRVYGAKFERWEKNEIDDATRDMAWLILNLFLRKNLPIHAFLEWCRKGNDWRPDPEFSLEETRPQTCEVYNFDTRTFVTLFPFVADEGLGCQWGLFRAARAWAGAAISGSPRERPAFDANVLNHLLKRRAEQICDIIKRQELEAEYIDVQGVSRTTSPSG